jgi:hypothetical protein
MLRQLIWWCNNFARSKGLQPGRAGYFQPDSFLNARVIMSDQSRAKEFVSADTAIVSCKLLRGILRPVSYVTLEHWALPGQREQSRPKQRRDWGIMTLVVDMRPIATPHTDLCGMATASAFRSDSEVCRVINLHRHSSGCPPYKSMMQSYYSID